MKSPFRERSNIVPVNIQRAGLAKFWVEVKIRSFAKTTSITRLTARFSSPNEHNQRRTGANHDGSVSFSGNVGIGTASPVVKLDVNGSVNLASGTNLTWGGAYGARHSNDCRIIVNSSLLSSGKHER